MNKKSYDKNKPILALIALAGALVPSAQAADINWNGPTGSFPYTDAAKWIGGKVPGAADRALLKNGASNVVLLDGQDWTLNTLIIGIDGGSGTMVQNGQTLSVSNGGFNLGLTADSAGTYTLNNGAINYNNGAFNVGALGTGALEIKGGSITGNGNFAVNIGTYASAITATLDAGTARTGYTWYEQGFNTGSPSVGLPPAGVSFTTGNYSYILAPYNANNAVMIDNITSPTATITLNSPATYSSLALLGSAGHGPMTVSYTVHHADNSVDTGTLSFADWFGSGGFSVGGRVLGDGTDIQLNGTNPLLYSMEISTTTASPITTIDLAWVSGQPDGHTCIMAVSGSTSTGGAFAPVAISGYNQDMVVEVGAKTTVDPSVVDTVTQSAGSVNTGGGQFFVGNVGAGIYNMSGGTFDVGNWVAFGRSGGNGTFNMTGGVLNQNGGGNLVVGTSFQAPVGSSPAGVINQSGGTINCLGEFQVPEYADTGVACSGTYNLSGTGALNVNNYFVIGRNNGVGALNMSGGTITKTGGGQFVVAAGGGDGTVVQNGGKIVADTSELVIGGGADASWTMNGGTNYFNHVTMARDLNSSAILALNGGMIQASGINSGVPGGLAYTVLGLNGGTLQATTNNATFISDLYQASIGSQGVTIDSQGFNISIPQDLVGAGGGLTKKGNGTLALLGNNSFSGATVSAGTLVVIPSTTGAGDYVVADGATLSVTVAPSLNSTLPVGNFTLGNSGLSIDLASFGNPSVAPVTASGNLAVNGTVTVYIADLNPQIGRFPLIQYASRTGTGKFVIGSLPFAVNAVILTNAVANTIDLQITSAELPRWNGQITGNIWDINNTANWINIGTGLETVYKEGNAVLFDDNATSPTVNLPGTVAPVSVEFKNNSLNYSLQGSGKITGATGIKMNGAATVTIANVNDFTGPVVINSGTLDVKNLANAGLPSSIGKSALVLAGGALNYSGPATTVNRSYSLQNNTNSTISVQAPLNLSGTVTAGAGAGLIKSGPSQLAYTTVGSNLLSGANSGGYRVIDGTALFDGSAGGQTNVAQGSGIRAAGSASASVIFTNTTIVTGDLQMGDKDNTIGSVTLNTGANVSANGWTVLGDGANSTGTLTINDGTLNLSGGRLLMGGRPGSVTTLNINGGVINKSGDYFAVVNGNWNVAGARSGVVNQVAGTVNCLSELWVGDGGGAAANGALGIYNLSGGTLTVNSWFGIGRDGPVGNFNMTGGTLNKTGGGDMVVGRGGSFGSFTMSGGTLQKNGGNPLIVGQGSGVGLFNQTGGTLNCDSEYWVGVDNGTFATNNIGGTAAFTINNWMSIGRGGNATFNFSGGTLNKANNGNFIVGDGGTGAFNQTGGALSINSELWIAQSGNGNGVYNLSAGSVTNNSWLAVGREGGKGILNITGGSMTKQGGGNVSITHGGGATATVNQSGGTFTVASGETWIGEDSGPATWNMNGGTATLGFVQLARNGNATSTLNLNAGTFTAYEIAGGSGTNFLSLNGGTIVAKDNHANFIHDIKAASIGSLGGTIDSQGYNITVPQVFTGSGAALMKVGSGTLTLTGTNTYANPTAVNGGKLAVNTESLASGDYTIGNNADLGVVLKAAGEQLKVANLTASGSSLDLDLGAFGNPSLAPLNVQGAFTLNGTLTINIADALTRVGSIPLVKYGSLAGSGKIVLGTLPIGVQAQLATNISTSTIELAVTYAGIPRWEGLVAGGIWDINSTTNWTDRGTLAGTVYQEGSAVLFDDNATGTTNVTLNTTVNPGSVMVNNSNLSYTISGTGKISGSTGLTKQGAGNLAINMNANDYTGPTIVSGGTVTVANLANGGSPSAIGAASANPANLVLANGTLSYTGPATAINRGYSVQNTNSVLDLQSDLEISGPVSTLTASSFRKTGPGSFIYSGGGSNLLAGNGSAAGYQVVAGAATFNGSNGGQTNRIQNDLWVGGTPASGASLVLTNTTLLVDAWLGLGRGNGTNGNLSTMSLYNSTAKFGNVSLGYWNNIPNNKATQVLTLNNSRITAGAFNVGESGGSDATLIMNGNSTITNSGDVNLANGGATATVNLNDTSVFHSQNRIQIGGGGSTGTVVVANSGTMRINNAWFSIGNGNTGTGNLLIKDNGTVYVSGDFNVTDTGTSVGSLTIQDNAVASGNTFYVSKNGGTLGVVNMTGGTVSARAGESWIGGSGNGTFNQSGGTFTVNNWMAIGRNGGGVGVYNLSGGTIIKNGTGNRVNVGENGTGTLNVSGSGSLLMGTSDLDITSGNGNGTINLNGGSITAVRITHVGGGAATLNFNGGTLIAGANANPAFIAGGIRAYVMTNGAVIDTAGNSIAIAQPLLDATNGSGGGLTKIGNGTLSLTAANTYSGLTRVNAGILAGTGSIAGPVTVASGGTIAVDASAIGTLTINNSLTLLPGSTTSVKITSGGFDKFAGLTSVSFGGTLVVTNTAGPGVYKLFNIGGTGNFSSIKVLPAGAGSFNAATGELTITDKPAAINSVTFSGGKLNISGSGGAANATYSLLTSTNVAAPLSAWTTNVVGTFDGNGLFTNSITPTSGEPTRFYLIKTP